MPKSDKSEVPPRASRRNFLKTSTAMVSAAVAGNLSISRSAHAAGDDVLKVGLIGCGSRGPGAALNALRADKNTKLVAMADVFEDRLKASRKNLKKIKPDQVAVDDDRCFVGFDAYDKLIQSGVDVVLIACASRFHPEYLKACIDAGKHVFIEKPHAIDAPGIHTVQAACELAEKKGLSVVSGLNNRYSPGIRETMKRVHDGAIGDIVAIQETFVRGPYRLRTRKPEWTEMEWQMRNWYHFNWLSGDDVVQTLVHSLDKAAWAMHEQPPAKAWGMGGRSSCFEPKFGDTFDHHAVVYEYPGGVRMYGYCRDQNGCYGEVSDKIFGTKGRCNLSKCRIEGETNWRYRGAKAIAYDIEHQELFASIRAGKPINNGLYMVRSTMLAILGRIVCYTGQSVTWDQAMASEELPGPECYAWDVEPPVTPDENGRYPIPIPGITKFP